MKHKLAWLPNVLTFGNLFCGFLAILFAVHSHYPALPRESPEQIELAKAFAFFYFRLAMLMMFFAGICDFFDGYLARKFGVSCDFGRELDSLADVVSFGVAPAILIFERAFTDIPDNWWCIIPIGLYVCCAAGRLARFNVISSEGRKPYFVGMPIEGGAALLISIVLYSTDLQHPVKDHTIMIMAIAITIIASVMMVSTIRFTATPPLWVRIGALCLMVVGFAFSGPWTPLIPLAYVVYGVCNHFLVPRVVGSLFFSRKVESSGPTK